MKYLNSDFLRAQFRKDGSETLAQFEEFLIEENEYQKHLTKLRQTSHEPEDILKDRAAYRALTHGQAVAPRSLAPSADPRLGILLTSAAQLQERQREQAEAVSEFHEDLLARMDVSLSGLQSHVNTTAGQLNREIRAVGQELQGYVRGQVLQQNEQLLKAIVASSAVHDIAFTRFRRLICVLVALLAVFIVCADYAFSQNVNPATVVAVCGTPPAVFPAAGSRAAMTVNTNGELCAGVSVSATVATAGLATSVTVGVSSSSVVMTMAGGIASIIAPGTAGGPAAYVNGTVMPFSFEADGDLRVAASVTPAANATVDINLVRGSPAITNGNGILAVAGAASSGLIIQGSGTGGAVIVGFQTSSPSVTVTDGAGALNVIVDSGVITTVTAVTAITNALPAGTNGIGKLTANSGVDIGDVDVTSAVITTFPDNEPFNAAQWGGTAVVAAATAGIATTATAQAWPTDPVRTGGQYTPLSTDLSGYLRTRTADPCTAEAKSFFVVDIVTATTTEIANQVSAEFFYICSVNFVTAGANNVVIVEDDTDTCGSPTAGLNGGVTAAEGWNFAANGGIALGSGQSTVLKTATLNRYLCIITSAAVQLSGTVAYVSAP